MNRKKLLEYGIGSVNVRLGNQIFIVRKLEHSVIVADNDNVDNATAVKSIQKIIESKIDVKNTNLSEIFIMSGHLLDAGLINNDEYEMLINSHNIDKNQFQNFINLWMRRKKMLCRYKSSSEEIAKAQEIISILGFVDILK